MMNRCKTTVLLTCLNILMMALGTASGKAGMVVASFMACAANLFIHWFPDRLVLFRHEAQESTTSDNPFYKKSITIKRKAFFRELFA